MSGGDTTSEDAAMGAAREAAAGGGAEGLLERLVDRIGGRTGVQAVFGAPIERDGSTIIPVARVRWGFGGGSGSGPVAGADGDGVAGGSGGGGAAGAVPVGYIELGPSGATFRPIVDPYPNPLFLLAVGLMVSMMLRGLARLLRG